MAGVGSGNLEISALRGLKAVVALEPEWWELWRRSVSATPFQSPAWLLPWIAEFAPAEVVVLVARSGGRPAGLLPLFQRCYGTDRYWLPCGAGASDYLDGIFAPGLEDSAGEVLLDAVGTLHGPATLGLYHLRPDSPLLAAPPPPGWAEERAEGEPCPVLALPAAVEDLPSVLPKRMAQNLRYYERRAERTGCPRLEQAGPGEALRLFEVLLDLHRARRAERGGPSALDEEAMQRFHRATIPALTRAKLLRLYILHIGDRPAAAYWGFSAKGRAYYYNGGFDPDLAPLGVGTLMIAQAIEQSVREGCYEFDFLIGREPYKYLWGAQDRPTYVRSLQPPLPARS